MRTGARSHRWLKMTKRCEVAHHKPFFRCLFDRLPVQTVTSGVHHPIVRGKSDQSLWLIGMQFFFNLCRWKTCMSHDGRKRILFWSNSRNAFYSCFSPQLTFFMKSFTKAATKKVEKTIFVLRKKWRENERGRDRERGRIRAAKPEVFFFFFWLRFCQTWTKWYLITTQTRVKCVAWIHHRTILKSDKMSKKKKKKKKTRIQEYTWNTKTPDGSYFNFQTALHAVVVSTSWAEACKYSFASSGQMDWYSGIELQLVLSDFLFWFQWLLCLLCLGLSPNAGTKTSRSTAWAVFYHYKHYKQFIFVWPWTFWLIFFGLAGVSFCVFPHLLDFDTSAKGLNFSSLRLLHSVFFNTYPVIFADLFKV